MTRLPGFYIWFFLQALPLIIFPQASKTYLFVGSYTGGKPGTGVYVYEFNTSSGRLKLLSKVGQIINPSFISLSPSGQFLYACTNTRLPAEGSVSAFKIDSVAGKLSFINRHPAGGENPVYLTVNKNNDFVVNANYTAGNVSVFKTNADGSLKAYSQLIQFSDSSILKERQDQAHIHAAVFSPDCRYIFLPDLGADKIRAFEFDAAQQQPLIALEGMTVKTMPGSGPRHFVFHPFLAMAYCIEELGGSVSVYTYAKGKLDSVQRIFSYSKKQDAYGSSDLHISPDGLFLYTSNRWNDENTIAIFSIDQQNGRLSLVGHQSTFGDHPRMFAIDPAGNFLLVANQVSGNIVVFKRNIKTGLLQKISSHTKVSFPSCLQMRTYYFDKSPN